MDEIAKIEALEDKVTELEQDRDYWKDRSEKLYNALEMVSDEAKWALNKIK